jgi:hypothetical protein
MRRPRHAGFAYPGTSHAAAMRKFRVMHEYSEKTFYVDMIASKPCGVIYTGMTGDLSGRAREHRERVLEGFTKRSWTKRSRSTGLCTSNHTLPWKWRSNAVGKSNSSRKPTRRGPIFIRTLYVSMGSSRSLCLCSIFDW